MRRLVFACDRCDAVTPAVDSVFVRRASGTKLRVDFCQEHLEAFLAQLPSSNGKAPPSLSAPSATTTTPAAALVALCHCTARGHHRYALLRRVAQARDGMAPVNGKSATKSDVKALVQHGLVTRTGHTVSIRWHVTELGRAVAALPFPDKKKGAHA